MAEILVTDPVTPDGAVIDEAVDILRAGGVIAYPTETLYGLAADAGNEGAIERIFAIKGREFHNPIPLIIGDRESLPPLVSEIPGRAVGLMDRFWPGPLTLIFHAAENLSPRLTAGTGTIGIRLSSHAIARSLAHGIGGAITATSANLSGEGGMASPERVLEVLGDEIDALIDGGTTPGGPGSTILDITRDPPVVLREGAIPAASLMQH